MPLPAPKVAFIAGCNGVSGNALVEYLIRQPKTEWSRIVVSSRSPLKNYWQDPRVEFLSIDFLKPVDEIMETMQPLCKEVTHAYFAAYVHTDDFSKLKEMNVPLFKNFLTAIDTVAGDSLQRVCLQTGGKHYGAHLGPTESPLHEGMSRYDDKGENFYYDQEDFLFALHKQRKWSWNVIRPNAIIGFTPGKNGMSQALTLALYILVCKEQGEVPIFPGNKYVYNAVDDNSFAGGLADISVWATTNEHTRNEDFVHVNGDCFVWRYFFQKIGKYFGVDIPPQTEFLELGADQKFGNGLKMADWSKDKKPIWESICKKYGGNPEAIEWGTWGFLDWTTGKAWPTISTMSKARKFGWHRHDDTYETWVETYKSFENAGVLPRNHLLHTVAGKSAGSDEAKVMNGIRQLFS